jgi:hypothetical protein
MSNTWDRDQRFNYDGEGRQIGYSDRYTELLKQEDAQRSRSSGGGSAMTPILAGLFAFGWAVQELRASFPFWELLILVVLIALVSSWAVRRRLLRGGDLSIGAINIISAMMFLTVSVLLGATVYDLDRWGTRVLILFIGLFVLFLVIGFAMHLFSAIARNPIGAVIIVTVSGWLIWVIFIQKPDPSATTVVPSQARTTPVRKNNPPKRARQIRQQTNPPTESAPLPESSRDVNPPQVAAPSNADGSKPTSTDHPAPDSGKNQDNR